MMSYPENRYRPNVCDPNVLDEMCPDHNRLCDAGSAELRWMRCGVARDYIVRSSEIIGVDLPICGTVDQVRFWWRLLLLCSFVFFFSWKAANCIEM